MLMDSATANESASTLLKDITSASDNETVSVAAKEFESAGVSVNANVSEAVLLKANWCSSLKAAMLLLLSPESVCKGSAKDAKSSKVKASVKDLL